jgi:hypothetical protein
MATRTDRRAFLFGWGAGAASLAAVSIMVGQGAASKPAADASDSQYFVTGDYTRATLWIRQGDNSLVPIGHGDRAVADAGPKGAGTK